MTALSSSRVVDLRVENCAGGLGFGSARPRLSWKIVSTSANVGQSAYRIRVETDRELSWDSGRVESEQSIHVAYDGTELRSRERYTARVMVWDQNGAETNWSEPVVWEMGLLSESDWSARWIEPEGDFDSATMQPAPYLRRDFECAGDVTAARVYATAHGVYELYVNGVKVGDQLFAPGWTSYHHRLQCQAYDVTDLLRSGENTIGAVLGDGWYRGEVGPESHRNTYGTLLGLLLQLEVTLADGTTVTVSTDSDWRASTGPIVRSDLQDGEVYDARLQMSGWSEPGFDDSTWKPVEVAETALSNLFWQATPPIRRKERLAPVEIIATPSGQTVLDFGQNISGRVRFTLTAPAGTTITLRHREALTSDGNLVVEDGTRVPIFGIYMPSQKNVYTFRGDGPETYEPHFTTAGFRYVAVEGYPGTLNADRFEAVAIHSDLALLGEFSCSDERVNTLHRNVLWSQKGNFMDIPTDCPTRERAGWTGDAQIFARTGSTLMDTSRFFAKWLGDLAADQGADGRVPGMIPSFYTASGTKHLIFSGTDGSAGWGDAAVIIPWTLYEVFGDTGVLADQYPSMKAWFEYIQRNVQRVNWSRKLSPRYWLSRKRRRNLKALWDTKFHFGEWLEPGVTMPRLFAGVFKSFIVSNPLVASAYYKNTVDLLARIAGVLSLGEEAENYRDISAKIRTAYGEEFIRHDGRMKPDRQASYVRALAFDLVPDKLRPAVVNRLVTMIEQNDGHLGTGFLSTGLLLEVLAAHGHLDLAYDLLMKDTPPSWLYSVKAGATTVWEGWNAIGEGGEIEQGSHNHYSKGAVVEWLYRSVAGIEILESGYKKILIRPRPGGGLSWASAVVQSMYGPVRSSWSIDGDTFKLEIEIPPNTTAQVELPDGSPIDLGSGEHTFSCRV